MEVFVGHQHRKPNPPPWPRQSVHRPSTISMEMVCRQNRTTNPRLFIFSFRASIRNIFIRDLEDALGHAGWQWMRCKGQTQSLQFVHRTVTARWRIVAVSSGLENQPLDNCKWRVQSDSDGAARSSPYLEKRKCVSTRLMRSNASCMHQDTRHLH